MPMLLWAQSSRVDTLRSLILDGGKSNYVMIFAHRGDWRNAPAENSLLAYQRCIDEGIDGIEIDLQMTRDGVLVVMHDETLDRTTTGKGKVCDYTLEELKNLYLLSPIGVVTRQRIPTFEEVLELAKGRILILVDKWLKIKDLVIETAKRHNCLSQIVLRSSLSSFKFQEKVGSLPNEIIYIPVLVCKGKGDLEKLIDIINNYTIPIASFSFIRDDFEILKQIPLLKKKGYRIWLNSLWGKFNGGHDDELGFIDVSNSYEWLINSGANIIFSDNPLRLRDYLKNINKRKTL
jgi:glycerophosphoryl diester phosphodiesterase